MQSGAADLRAIVRWVSTLALIGWSLLWGILFVLLAIRGEILAAWGIALPVVLLGLATGSVLAPRVAGIGALLLAGVGISLLELPPVFFGTPFALGGVLLLVSGPWTWMPRRGRTRSKKTPPI